MPTPEKSYNQAPDNAERSSLRDAFGRRGAIQRVDIAAAAGVTSIDMRAIGLAGRHVRITNAGAVPVAFFLEAKSTATPPVQTTPDPAARATFDAAGMRTANPQTQCIELPAGASARRFVSAKFPMLQANGTGGAGLLELEDATI
ncbi:MAG TPA: hypothetical protein ENK57_11960 [Polyangiaceae bacterium]|nr:hypothetical protein [Polyangiaceae bacterium]